MGGLIRCMTVRAARIGMVPVCGKSAVHTASIYRYSAPRKEIVLTEQIEVLMAVSTGFRKVEWIDARISMARIEDIMHAMTVCTGGNIIPSRHGKAAVPLVEPGFHIVATSTRDRGNIIVRGQVSGSVAVLAIKFRMRRERERLLVVFRPFCGFSIKAIGISASCLRHRLRVGWTVDAALGEPLRPGVRPDGCEAT